MFSTKNYKTNTNEIKEKLIQYVESTFDTPQNSKLKRINNNKNKRQDNK